MRFTGLILVGALGLLRPRFGFFTLALWAMMQ